VFAVDPDDIAGTRVLATMIGGRWVHGELPDIGHCV
jgi:hypothetical protein